jgi:hypothetical protein
MKNQLLQQFPIRKANLYTIALSIIFSLNFAVFTAAADAACRSTGKRVAGLPILRCTGSTRCRPTGRYKTVRGFRYQILRCPR